MKTTDPAVLLKAAAKSQSKYYSDVQALEDALGFKVDGTRELQDATVKDLRRMFTLARTKAAAALRIVVTMTFWALAAVAFSALGALFLFGGAQ